MSTNKTPKLNLHSWVNTDHFMMSEFNENFSAIDAEAVHLRFGSYVGNGVYGQENPTGLTFDFEPKMVLVSPPLQEYDYPRMLVLRGVTKAHNAHSTASNADYRASVIWEGNSVSWYSSSARGQYNNNGTTYYYLVLG